MLINFHSAVLNQIEKTIESYGFFDHMLAPSTDITERDFCMVLSNIFEENQFKYKIEFPLKRKTIDFCIKHSDTPHYIEVKDCGLFETKYAKSLAYCEDIEAGTYESEKTKDLIFGEGNRTGSKTNWLTFFSDIEKKRGKIAGTEGLARDAYKLYRQFEDGLIKQGDLCTCIAFVFWPQPFPETNRSFSLIEKGDKTIKVGTQCLIGQLKNETHMKEITYDIKTIDLPGIEVLNPFKGIPEHFEASELRLTIEMLSWKN